MVERFKGFADEIGKLRLEVHQNKELIKHKDEALASKDATI